jgi:DNA-binding CsgD family transcriptional regulator
MLQAAIAEFEMAACDPAGRERARLAMSDGQLVREVNGEGALVCGWLTLLAADDEAGMDSLDAAVGQAHLHGSVRALAAAYCFRALGRVWRGQLGEAEQDAREALRLARTGQVDMDPTFAGAYLADSLIEQGRLAEAETVLSALGVPGEMAPRPVYSALDTYVRLVHQQARHELAVATAAEADRTWSAFGFRNPAFGSWRTSASLSLSALDRVSEARTLAREELDLATTWGAPRALGRALRTVGQVTSGPEAVEFLRRSTSILEQSNARLERAKSLHALGSALRRGGQRTEARRWLARALDDAEICGAKPVADQAAADLRAAGARPRRDRLTGADALTPSERRVADAAAQGATNREIAQALFVTIKTVEVHLSSAFRKLGASRRSDLPGLLHPVQ